MKVNYQNPPTGHSGDAFERLSIAFTANGKREFVPRDQVFHLLVVYYLF